MNKLNKNEKIVDIREQNRNFPYGIYGEEKYSKIGKITWVRYLTSREHSEYNKKDN